MPRGTWVRVSGGDPAAQRAVNAAAPHIDRLGSRILALFHPYRARLAVTIGLVLTAAALSVIPPLLTQRVFDEGLFAPGGVDMPRLLELVGLMLAIYVVNGGLGVWQTYLTSQVGNSVMGDLRVRMFAHLQAMELTFFTRTKTGAIQSRLLNDVGGVADVLTNTVSNVVGNVVTVAAAFVAMVMLDWRLALVALVVMPVLAVAQRKIGVVRARIAAETQESLSTMTAMTQETLNVSGVLLAKSFNQQDAEVERYRAENRNQVRLQLRQAMSGQGFFATVGVVMQGIPVLVYLIAGWLMSTGHGPVITAGTIVAFTTVQARLIFPLMGIMRVALDLQTSSALFARIFEYLDLAPAIADVPDARDVPAGRLGAVTFDRVSFRYPGAEPDQRATLEDLSFEIAPGQFAAFVGPSGAGKTTISYLIPRLFDATSGHVLFGGVDVRELRRESLVDHIGIVSQETYLFHATITENLRYALPGATDEQVRDAARAANIHDTIMSFPDGYDTMVGERGYRLSGGEKQRIALARVLLKDPEVMILDEATSALDSHSEHVVQAALASAVRGRTTVAIAHRLSTVVDADVIFVVVDGRIVERGTHAELVVRGGVYAGLVTEQLGVSA